jgi:hypothetical protein
MASTDRPTIHIHSTEDLLALIPFILGFHPDSSLVLVAMNRYGVPFTARMSLPTTPETAAALSASLDTVTANLPPRDRVTDDGTGPSAGGGSGRVGEGDSGDVNVTLVGYGPADPVQKAVAAAIDALQHAGIPIRETLRVADGRFWRLDGTEPASGPVDGTAFDPSDSPVTAAAVYAGLVALPDRGALADTLAPVSGGARDRMVAATAMACEFFLTILDAARTGTTVPDETGSYSSDDSAGDPDAALRTPLGLALQKAARSYLTQALDSYRAGRPVGDDHAAALTVLLDLPSLREFAARGTSGEAWQVEMWTDLVRRAQPPFTAGPATMLALSAMQAGSGPLASVAIDRALDTDPGNRLAHLLGHALAAGIDPATVTALLAT